MTVECNRNFKLVRLHSNTYKLKDLLTLPSTLHSMERITRIQSALHIAERDEIDRVFYVDKGHQNGAELHYVTVNGIIYIYNERTMRLITVLIARRNQVNRLYEACGIKADTSILEKCTAHSNQNLNV